MMIMASRTLEGSPWRCPMCAADVRMEPSWPSGDATCPHCGTLLWPERRYLQTTCRFYRWLLKTALSLGLLVCASFLVVLPVMLAVLAVMLSARRQLFGLGPP